MRYLRTATALVLLLVLWAPSAAAPVQDEDPSLVTGGAKLFLRNGDMVSANGRSDSLLRFRVRPRRIKVRQVPLGVRLKPKGVTYDKFCEQVAIANSKNVVLFDVWTREVTVVEDERFGLISDVEFDMMCNLIIADQGRQAVGRWPRDGHLWMLRPDGEILEVGRRHHNWINPAFLDMDQWGTLYVVDKSAGFPMPGNGEWFFDAIYKLGPPNYQWGKAKFRRGDITASSFALHPDGRFLIGNEDRLLVLEDNQLREVCADNDFTWISGIDVDPDLNVFAMDGFDLFGRTRLVEVDLDGGSGRCDVEQRRRGARINGSQGLAVGLPAR